MKTKRYYRLSILVILVISFSFFFSCDVFNGNDESEPLSGEAGEIIWSVDHQKTQAVSTQPLIDDNRVFVLHDGFLRAYELKTGERIWSQTIFNSDKTRIFALNLLADDENVYIDWGFSFAAFKKESGLQVWRNNYTGDGTTFSGLAGAKISMNDTYLFLPRKMKVLKVDKENGNVASEFPLMESVPEGIEQGATQTLPSSFGDNILYVITNMWDTTLEQPLLRGNVFAFDINSGEPKWIYTPPNKVKATDEFEADSLQVETNLGDIRITDEHVYVSGGLILKLNRQTGMPVWIRPLKSQRFPGIPGEENTADGVLGGMDIDNQGIYLATAGGFALKLDPETADEIWRVDVIFTVQGIVTVLDKKMYFNNDGGSGIWIIDTETGKVLFNENPPGQQENRDDVYVSSLGVGEGFMVNVGGIRVYTLRSFE